MHTDVFEHTRTDSLSLYLICCKSLKCGKKIVSSQKRFIRIFTIFNFFQALVLMFQQICESFYNRLACDSEKGNEKAEKVISAIVCTVQ